MLPGCACVFLSQVVVPPPLLLDAQFGVLFLLGGLGRAVAVRRIRSTAGRVRLVPTDVDRFGLIPNAVLRNVNGLHIRSGHFEHRFEQECLLQNGECVTLFSETGKLFKNCTMIALNPRAPVCLSIASWAICFRAPSAKVSSTWSIPSRALYCGTRALRGSVRIRTNMSTSKLWNGTSTGKRPTNSCRIMICRVTCLIADLV